MVAAMSNCKKVSVVMCTYNGSKYIREQLDSILNQTYPIFELLVQDDNSQDDTFLILQEYEKKVPYMHVIRNERNVGIARNFKSIFDRAQGEYIVIADQDDIWIENKIALLLETMEDNYLVVSASYLLYGKYDASVKRDIASESPDFLFQEQRYVALQATLSGHDMLFKKELLSHIPEVYWQSYWYDFCLAVVAIGMNKIIYSDRYLTLWRRHDNAYSYAKKSHNKYILFLQLFIPLVNKASRNDVKTFYRLLLPALKQNEIAYQFARYLSEGKLWHACWFTYVHRTLFVNTEKVKGIRLLLRSFLIPLLTCRNIKNWHSMYLGDKNIMKASFKNDLDRSETI